MIVRMLTSISSVDRSWSAGELYDTDDGTAARLVERGFAAYLAPAAPEQAVPDFATVERAVKPKGKGRG